MLASVTLPKTRAAAAPNGKRSKTVKSGNGTYSVPVVRSTFCILEELSRTEHLGLREVTQITKIPKSTVFRILSTLVELGYVSRDANRNYRISPMLGNLVSSEVRTEELRRLAVPLMLELRDKYGETVNLGIQQFDKVTYLEVVPSEFALRLQESRGASVPAHASALGKAILAFSPEDSVNDLIHSYKFERVTEHTIVDSQEFLSELKRVRNAGVAFDRGEGSALAVCVSAPILDDNNTSVAAMSISGPASRFNPKRESAVIASLLKAAADISRAYVRTMRRRS